MIGGAVLFLWEENQRRVGRDGYGEGLRGLLAACQEQGGKLCLCLFCSLSLRGRVKSSLPIRSFGRNLSAKAGRISKVEMEG